MAIVATGRRLEDIVFRQVNICQIFARSYDLIRGHSDLCLVGKKVLLKDSVLGDTKQVGSLWELSFFNNSVKAVSVDIFKFISKNITAICQLT